MKKKLIILSCFLICSLLSTAQITLTPQVPPTGAFMKKQLWNISLIATNAYPDASISLILIDAVTGDPVLTALTPDFDLTAGVNQLTPESLPGISYEYLSPDFTDHNPDGFLLAGSYTACYKLNLNIHGMVVDECIPVLVEPVSPPILNTPADEEVIQTHNPQFTWIPPAPVEIFSYLNYDFKIVEVHKEQNPLDAVQQNLAIYNSNQVEPYLNYPSSANMLDTGKLYAWQVTAKNKNTFSAQSEVWTFTIANLPVLQNSALTNNFQRLKKTLDGSVGTAVETLNAYYLNESDDSLVTYKIADVTMDSASANSYHEVKFGTISLTPGQNAIVIPFTSSDNLEHGRTYLFELTNSRQEKWSLKFIYFKSNQ